MNKNKGDTSARDLDVVDKQSCTMLLLLLLRQYLEPLLWCFGNPLRPLACALQYKPENQADSQSLQRVHYTEELLRVEGWCSKLMWSLASEHSLGTC